MIRINNLGKGICCIIGGFLIHFSLGTIYTFGNMSPYVASYLKYRTTDTWISNGHMVWVFSITAMGIGIFMSIGGIIEKKIGARITCLIGCWTMSLGVVLTNFTIKLNIWCVTLTYGVLFGVGSGLAYSVALASPVKWFPNRKGMVVGMVSCGYGLGSLVFNLIQTAYINPMNIAPNMTTSVEKYFTDSAVLDNIPFCFVLIGLAFAIIQLIGVILLTDSSFRKPSGQTKKPLENRNCIEKINPDNMISTDKSNNQNSTDENIAMNEKNEIKITSFIPHDFTFHEAIKDIRLWIIWSTFLFNGIYIVSVSSLYKSFGQTFIKNDRFISLVGGIAAIFNAAGRPIIGRLLDIIPYRKVMTVLTMMMSLLIGSFYFCSTLKSASTSEAMYFIWVCLLFFGIAGNFASFPTITSQCFGSTNMAIIFGFIFFSYSVSALIGAVLCSQLLPKMQYSGIFVLNSFTTLSSLILTQFFVQNPNPIQSNRKVNAV